MGETLRKARRQCIGSRRLCRTVPLISASRSVWPAWCYGELHRYPDHYGGFSEVYHARGMSAPVGVRVNLNGDHGNQRSSTMEKKEARIKCTGCGTSYKIKIPVTDKPVSFKCKKCGKVLKLRIKAAAAAEAPPPPERLPELETSQLPELDYVPPKPDPKLQKTPRFVDTYLFPGAGRPEQVSRWIVLSDDLIKGPFTETEIVHMIETGEVTANTSLRMGERPWIKAADTPDFKDYFVSEQAQRPTTLGSVSLLEQDERAAAEKAAAGKPFHLEWPSLVRYPVASGDPKPLIIFFGLSFVLSIILLFPLVSRSVLEVLLRLVLLFAVCIVPCGYLADLMSQSLGSPDAPPPAWDFSKIKQYVMDGLKVLAVVLAYWWIPVGICVGLTVFFILNHMQVLSYVCIAVTILVFFAFFGVVAPALAILAASSDVGRALNPSELAVMMRRAQASYLTLAVASMATGLICLVFVILALLLAEIIPDAGFVVAGIVMALGLSYCLFVWFHVLGRYAAANRELTAKVPAGA